MPQVTVATDLAAVEIQDFRDLACSGVSNFWKDAGFGQNLF
jgi:hypothetical protein